jgi:hypothetical protein
MKQIIIGLILIWLAIILLAYFGLGMKSVSFPSYIFKEDTMWSKQMVDSINSEHIRKQMIDGQ